MFGSRRFKITKKKVESSHLSLLKNNKYNMLLFKIIEDKCIGKTNHVYKCDDDDDQWVINACPSNKI